MRRWTKLAANPVIDRRTQTWVAIALLTGACLGIANAEVTGPFEEGGPATEATRMPAPKPFSLSAGDAVGAIALLQRVGFLSVLDTDVQPGGTGRGRPPRERLGTRVPESYPLKTVEVREVWAVFLGLDESFPPGHQRRYDLVVNGSPMDWERTYIRYGGRRVHLQQLYTYRNQHPVPWELVPE